MGKPMHIKGLTMVYESLFSRDIVSDDVHQIPSLWEAYHCLNSMR